MKKVFQLLFITAAFTLLVAGGPRINAFQEDPTFNNQVVRIFQAKCQVCHHPGDIAPFSLMTYAEARPWARAIQEKVVLREMPPWKPVDGCGEFDGDRRLTDEDIATISRWADTNAREGDPASLPEPRTFPDVWPLGPPDVVLQADADYVVKPGADVYRCFSIPTALRGDRYISAIEIKPGNRNVVHHAIIYLDQTGVSKQLDDADPGPGYASFGGPGFDAAGTLGGWSPGARGRFEPEGNAWLLPDGVRAVIQVHYHPRDKIETDRTQVGLYFARQPVRKDIQAVPIVNDTFRIPAGDPHYKVTASATVPPGLALHLIGVYPHMHLLGREITVEAQSPGGSARCLIDIDKWSFQWQGMYIFKEQIPLPVGTTVRVTSYYDNSANNPLNPNSPPKSVAWGEQTTDEMCVVFLEVSLDVENRTPSSPAIKSVSVDSNDRLVVDGKSFLAGSDIEIDGTRLSDTINNKKKKKATKQLLSSGDWKSLLVPGRQASITVLNPDGVRSDSVAFTR